MAGHATHAPAPEAKRSTCIDEAIIGILKQHETGVCIADLRCKHGVSGTTADKWGGMAGAGMYPKRAR